MKPNHKQKNLLLRADVNELICEFLVWIKIKNIKGLK